MITFIDKGDYLLKSSNINRINSFGFNQRFSLSKYLNYRSTVLLLLLCDYVKYSEYRLTTVLMIGKSEFLRCKCDSHRNFTDANVKSNRHHFAAAKKGNFCKAAKMQY